MNEEDIPIDIHYNKLLDWLINRRHCNTQWQGAALEGRKKINNAIQDMPEHPEITKLLAGTYINYFHCLKIVEILKETEASSKNIFGRYSSQRMKDWQEIVKMYEKDGIYLAEAAQLVMRNVNYEIPALKKQVLKCQQTQRDCSRKQGEYSANSSELKEKYQRQCKNMGIEGKKIKTEMMSLVKDLPSTYERIAASTQELSKAADLYSAFVEFTLSSKELGADCIKLVKHIITKGNTTTYEWNHGKTPGRVEEDLLNYSIDDEDDETNADKADEIDFGDIDTTTSGIDFGAITLEEGAEIDFGEGGDIDWGAADDINIELVEQSVNEKQEVEDSDENVAKGADAKALLDNTVTRNMFIDELLELEAFLSQRVQEMKTDGDNVLSSSQFQNAPQSIQLDIADVEEMLSKVQSTLGQLSSTKMQDLMLIRSSPGYVGRVAEKLKKVISDSEKLMSLSRLMVTRREEAVEEERSVKPKLDLVKEKMKELQKQIEQEISKKYKNRRVNIMGEINTV